MLRLPVATGALNRRAPPSDELAQFLDFKIDRLFQGWPVSNALGLLDPPIKRGNDEPMALWIEFNDLAPSRDFDQRTESVGRGFRTVIASATVPTLCRDWT